MRSDFALMMPNEKQFVDTMQRLDVKLSDHVVCYDAGAIQFFGYRAAWMLQAMGHPNVQVLDGGFPKWEKEGRPVEITNADASAEDFGYKLNADKIKLYENIKSFEANEAERTFQLLDVRGPGEFEAGNIGGSSNVHFGKIINMDTKQLRSAEERRKVFEENGVDLEKDITLSCMSGVSAAVVYAGLSDIAKGKLSVYDGSWSEYKSKK